MKLLYQLWAFVRRDYLLARAVPLAFAWQAVSILLASPVLYYLGRLVPGATSPHLARFGGDYFAFVIVGVALFGFLSAAAAAAATAVRHEQTIGTLEVLFLTPVPQPLLVLGPSLWQMVIAAGHMLLYLAVGGLVFGMDFGRANVLSAAVILLLATGTSAALGVLAATFVLVFRHSDPLTSVVTSASALLGGVFYPTSVMPPLLQRAAEFLPQTHALRAIRLALLQGYGITALFREVAILALFCLLLMSMGLVAWRWAVPFAKASGTLGAY